MHGLASKTDLTISAALKLDTYAFVMKSFNSFTMINKARVVDHLYEATKSLILQY